MRGASYRSLRVGEGSGGAEMTANAEQTRKSYFVQLSKQKQQSSRGASGEGGGGGINGRHP